MKKRHFMTGSFAMVLCLLGALIASAQVEPGTRGGVSPFEALKRLDGGKYSEPAVEEIETREGPEAGPEGTAAEPAITINRKPLDTDPEMKVFKIREHTPTYEEAKTLADALFGGGEKLTRGEFSFHFVDGEDPTISFSMGWKRGEVDLCTGLSPYFGDSEVQLPPEGEAVELSGRYLLRAGLWPMDVGKAVVARIGALMAAPLDDGTKPLKKLVTVYYAREIAGRRVYGPGSKMVVQVGNGGEVVSVARKWSPVEESREAGDFRSSQEVYRDIEEQLREDWRTAERIEVEAPRLAYYDRGGEFIQPVYVFPARIHGEMGSFGYLGFVHALREVHEGIGRHQIERWPEEAPAEGQKGTDAE